MQQPCLPVPRRRKRDDDEPSFENIDSMDAMEYMAAVMQQANAIPDVLVSTVSAPQQQTRDGFVPIDGSAASLQYMVSMSFALPPPSRLHGPPNRAWVETTLRNFSKLRDYLEQCDPGEVSDRVPFPPMKDSHGWHEFCVGAEEAKVNPGSYFDDGVDMNENEGVKEEPLWRTSIPATGHEPTVRLVLQMDQVMIRRVFAHLAGFVNDGWSPCSIQRTAWFYALLARLEKPLHRDDAAILFGLLKQLAKTRARIQVERKEDLLRLNILIAIVGIYFEQGGGYANLMEPS